MRIQTGEMAPCSDGRAVNVHFQDAVQIGHANGSRMQYLIVGRLHLILASRPNERAAPQIRV